MINLDGLKFSPVSNSQNGRVSNEAIFIFEQNGFNFTAKYSGDTLMDGHIIGKMTGEKTAELIYHSRSYSGDLEAGRAAVDFHRLDDGLIMTMNWQWLNGDQSSGTSIYCQIL